MTDSEINELRKQLYDFDKKYDEVRRMIAGLETEERVLSCNIDQYKNKIRDLEHDCDRNKDEANRARSDIRRLEDKHRDVQRNINMLDNYDLSDRREYEIYMTQLRVYETELQSLSCDIRSKENDEKRYERECDNIKDKVRYQENYLRDEEKKAKDNKDDIEDARKLLKKIENERSDFRNKYRI